MKSGKKRNAILRREDVKNEKAIKPEEREKPLTRIASLWRHG